MRTIEAFEYCTDPVQEGLNEILLLQLFGQEEPLWNELCEVIPSTPAQAGLGVPNPKAEAPLQYLPSKLFTKHYVESIKCQYAEIRPSEHSTDELKTIQQTIKVETAKSRTWIVLTILYPQKCCLVAKSRDKGASLWLNAIPLKYKGLALNERKFRDVGSSSKLHQIQKKGDSLHKA